MAEKDTRIAGQNWSSRGMSARHNSAFTLVELMIVVAIIGILAAIAIPNFIEMQLRAKRAEVPVNLDGIQTCERGYDAAYDEVVATDDVPGTTQKELVEWTRPASGFDTIGWSPTGKVRGSYQVTPTVGSEFIITGRSDVDGDGNESIWTVTSMLNAQMNTAPDVY